MAKYDPEVANSSGYFKDPVTKEDLSADMPRVAEPTMEEWTWPLVTASDGSQVKIVYAYFTDFEKQCYKAYRARGKASTSDNSLPKVGRPVTTEKPVHRAKDTQPVEEAVDATPIAVSADTQMIIANCDKILGVSQIAGITYALLIRGSNTCTIYHIPRSLISEEEMNRLCNGVAPEEIIID